MTVQRYRTLVPNYVLRCPDLVKSPDSKAERVPHKLILHPPTPPSTPPSTPNPLPHPTPQTPYSNPSRPTPHIHPRPFFLIYIPFSPLITSYYSIKPTLKPQHASTPLGHTLSFIHLSPTNHAPHTFIPSRPSYLHLSQTHNTPRHKPTFKPLDASTPAPKLQIFPHISLTVQSRPHSNSYTHPHP